MLWCDERDITTRDSSLDELLASAGTRISRYQMTSFLFYLCTYELDIGQLSMRRRSCRRSVPRPIRKKSRLSRLCTGRYPFDAALRLMLE